jgi:hypothetical protein
MEPQAIADIYSQDVLSGFDFYKPEFLETLFRRYGDQGMSYFQLLRTLGWEKSSARSTYGHFEENRTHEIFHSRNNAGAPGAGVNHVITLDQIDLDSNNAFYPRLYDEVLFPNETVGYISDIDTTSPTGPVLTIVPVDLTDDLGALSGNDPLIIFSNIWSPGSGQPTGAVKGTYQYENDHQIIKETITSTGSQLVQQLWFKQYGDDGKTITGYYSLGMLDIDYRMNLRIDGALLFGKRVTNTAAVDPVTNAALQGTEGVFPFVRRLGNVSVIADGAFAMTDFDTIDRTLDQEGVGKYTLSLWGIERHQEVEGVLKSYLDNASTQYAVKAFNNDILKSNDSLGAVINFQYVLKSERLFMMKRFNNLNNPKLYGVGGDYKMPQYGLLLPMGMKKDPVNKNMVRSIGCRYASLGNYSRRTEVWEVGGAGPSRMKVTEFDNTNMYQRAEIGAHNMGGNQFVLVSPTIT